LLTSTRSISADSVSARAFTSRSRNCI
jgi:hypothetical protein